MTPTTVSHLPGSSEAQAPPTVVPPAAPSDEEVLGAIERGNPHALGVLYERHQRLAFAVAYRILQDREATEDALQDAFLAVWQRAATFEPARGSARSWLLAIVRHAAIDRRRGRQGRNDAAVPLEPTGRTLASEAGDLAEATAAADEADRIRRALAALPAEQRLPLELAYFGGLTHTEIASQLGLPLGTVKGRLRLGLQKLRLLLADLLPPASPASRSLRGERRAPADLGGGDTLLGQVA